MRLTPLGVSHQLWLLSPEVRHAWAWQPIGPGELPEVLNAEEELEVVRALFVWQVSSVIRNEGQSSIGT